MNKYKNFEITRMDSFGRGISVLDGKTFFVEKTLIGDRGQAIIHHEKNNFTEGHLSDTDQLETSSNLRMVPECPHFNECSSCQFLHTTYSNELDIKLKDLEFRLRKLKLEKKIEVFKDQDRFEHRNRVQLHYDIKSNQIGYRSSFLKKIHQVPFCKLPSKNIQNKIQELYQDNNWHKIVKGHETTGHIELYEKNKGEVSLAVNQRYAHLGFTQVNQPMNDLLKAKMHEVLADESYNLCVDLFAGEGNISQSFNTERLLFDYYTHPQEKLERACFTHCDLYAKDAIRIVQRTMDKSGFQKCDLLVIDPPRAGLKNIAEFIKLLKPKRVVYVSCDPATLTRDLESIASQIQIEFVGLFDFFPSTFHYETLAIFSVNS